MKFLSLLFFWFWVFFSLASRSISPVIHQRSFSNTVFLPFPRRTVSGVYWNRLNIISNIWQSLWNVNEMRNQIYLESRSGTVVSEGCRCLGRAWMMGSCNYSHKLSRRGRDGYVRESGEWGREEGWDGEKLRKRGSQWVALFSFFFFSLLWVCIMWRCVIGLWSHQSCANRLGGKHVSLKGCGGECVCCVTHRCETVWEMVWWSKTFINGEQVGQLTLSQTNLLSWARGERLELKTLCAVTHAYWIYSSMHRFSTLHLHSPN